MILTKQERRTVQAALMFWARACRRSKVHPTEVPFIAALFGPKDPHPLSVEQTENLALSIGSDSWDEQLMTLPDVSRDFGLSTAVVRRMVRDLDLAPVCTAGRHKFYRPADFEAYLQR